MIAATRASRRRRPRADLHPRRPGRARPLPADRRRGRPRRRLRRRCAPTSRESSTTRSSWSRSSATSSSRRRSSTSATSSGVGGQLSTGVIVVLGIRIFSNVAADPAVRLPCLRTHDQRSARPAADGPVEPAGAEDPATRTPRRARLGRRPTTRAAAAARGAVPAVAGPGRRRRPAGGARLRGDHPGPHQHHRQQLRRLPRAGPRRRALRAGRHLPACPGGDQPARGERDAQLESSQLRAERGAGRGPEAGAGAQRSWPAPSRCTGPGIRVTVTRGSAARRRRLRARHDRGAAVGRRRGDAGQRQGPAGRPELGAVDAVGHRDRRRGSSTSPYVFDVIGDPHTLQGALQPERRPDRGVPGLRRHACDVQEQKALDITTVHKRDRRRQFAQPD